MRLEVFDCFLMYLAMPMPVGSMAMGLWLWPMHNVLCITDTDTVLTSLQLLQNPTSYRTCIVNTHRHIEGDVMEY